MGLTVVYLLFPYYQQRLFSVIGDTSFEIYDPVFAYLDSVTLSRVYEKILKIGKSTLHLHIAEENKYTTIVEPWNPCRSHKDLQFTPLPV